MVPICEYTSVNPSANDEDVDIIFWFTLLKLEDTCDKFVERMLENEAENVFRLSAKDDELLLTFCITVFTVAAADDELLKTVLFSWYRLSETMLNDDEFNKTSSVYIWLLLWDIVVNIDEERKVTVDANDADALFMRLFDDDMLLETISIWLAKELDNDEETSFILKEIDEDTSPNEFFTVSIAEANDDELLFMES